MIYYVIWPYDHRKATILSTHATIKDAYAELDELREVFSSLGCTPAWWVEAHVVDQNHLPESQLPPNQLPVGE